MSLFEQFQSDSQEQLIQQSLESFTGISVGHVASPLLLVSPNGLPTSLALTA
jgi:hypothetical protein